MPADPRRSIANESTHIRRAHDKRALCISVHTHAKFWRATPPLQSGPLPCTETEWPWPPRHCAVAPGVGLWWPSAPKSRQRGAQALTGPCDPKRRSPGLTGDPKWCDGRTMKRARTKRPSPTALYVRADPALLAALDALSASARAREPGRRCSRADVVREILTAALARPSAPAPDPRAEPVAEAP